jgi:hypothetical protein
VLGRSDHHAAATPEALADQLGDKVITDALRIRHVRAADACALLEQRDAEDARHRAAEAAHREHLAAMQRAVLARVAAIQARQCAQRANGDIDSGMDAFAVMTMDDPNDRLTAAGQQFEELLGAAQRGDYGVMHRLDPKEGQR